MKKLYILIFALVLVKILSCKKEEPPVTTVPPATTTPPADTTKPYVPIVADTNTFIFKGKKYTISNNESINSDTAYYNILGQVSPSYCKVYLKKQPALNSTYSCVKKAASALTTTEAFIEIGVPDSAGALEVWSSTTGNVTINLSSAKVSAIFGQVAFTSNTTAKTDTGYGHITSPIVPYVAAANTFIFGGKEYVFSYNECLYPVSSYYYMNGQISPSYCKVFVKKKPTVKVTYNCVKKAAGTLTTTEAFIEIKVPNSTGTLEIWSSTSGKVTVYINATKATAIFSNVVFTNNTTAATDTADGHITCP